MQIASKSMILDTARIFHVKKMIKISVQHASSCSNSSLRHRCLTQAAGKIEMYYNPMLLLRIFTSTTPLLSNDYNEKPNTVGGFVHIIT